MLEFHKNVLDSIDKRCIMSSNSKRWIYLFVGLSFFLMSCNSNTMFDNSHNFKDNSWNKTDTATFVVSVSDTLTEFSSFLTLRTSKQYLYSNLWVYILITAPDNTSSKVAQMIPITYPDGSWIGRVSGSLVESRLNFGSQTFPLKGDYVFQILNATQEEEIPFVEDISLRIEKMQKK